MIKAGFNLINFYYFSGTGNTLLIVKKMKEVFERNGIRANLNRIEKSDPGKVDPNSLIGLAFPVAMQGTYPFVWDFIKALPKANGTPIFMVDTLHAFSGGVVGPVRKIVEKKGYRPLGAMEIVMHNNLFPPKVIAKKKEIIIRKALEEAQKYTEQILNKRSRWGRIPLLSDIMSKISQKEGTWGFIRKVRSLKVNTSKCVKCGLCVKLCPVQNIEMEEFPEFQDKCVICMRCVSFCPHRAIYQGKANYQTYRAVDANQLLAGSWGEDLTPKGSS